MPKCKYKKIRNIIPMCNWDDKPCGTIREAICKGDVFWGVTILAVVGFLIFCVVSY